MKKIRSMIAALAAVSLLALTATSCEKVAPDNSGVKPDAPAVTADDNSVAGNDENSSTEDSKASDSKTDDIGKPPKMNEDNIPGQQKANDGPTLTIPDIEANAGEEVTFKIDITDNTGFTALIAWIDLNDEYFEFVSAVGGDADDEENEDSVLYSNLTANTFNKEDAPGTTTIVCFYFDGNLETYKENTTYATVTLKVKEDTPAGKYDLAFDADGDGNGSAMCNDCDRENEVVIIRTPTYKNGSITVK